MTTRTRITPHTRGKQNKRFWKTLIESIGKGKVKKRSNNGEMAKKNID
jgi:hypothetical protein